MKTLTKAIALGSIAVLTALPLHAGQRGHGGGIDNRLDRQHNRIEQGIDSGELTRREARKLLKQNRRLTRLTRELRDDGLTRKERRHLQAKLDRASERIYVLKHNDKRRGGRYYDDRWDYGFRHNDRGFVFWIDENDDWPRYGYTR